MKSKQKEIPSLVFTTENGNCSTKNSRAKNCKTLGGGHCETYYRSLVNTIKYYARKGQVPLYFLAEVQDTGAQSDSNYDPPTQIAFEE